MIDYRKDNKWTVYIHIVPKELSGYDYDKYYVGVTSQTTQKRWRNGNGYLKNKHFYRAINKYGWNNIIHQIIAEKLTKVESCNLEKILIKKLKSNDYHYGYNISSGGESGKSGVATSYLQKKVTSDRMKELWQEPKYREKEIQKLRELHDDNWRRNQSEKIKKNWQNPIYREMHSGINHPAYGLKRQSLYGSENYNAKKVVCLNTGEIFDSMVEAESKYKLYKGGVGAVCNKTRTHVGIDKNGLKMVWRFYDDFISMSDEEINLLIMEINKPKYNINKFVVNLDTNQLFSSQVSGAKHCNINSPCNIGGACRAGTKSGGYKWVFYKDYLIENNVTDVEARKSLFFVE